MCGICGPFGEGIQVSADALERMNQTLVRRGPDEDGIFLDAGVGLAMRRLSIIDLSGGRQPIHNEDSTVWVVFNGEIYNYRELRAALLARGHRFGKIGRASCRERGERGGVAGVVEEKMGGDG